jgi:CYTH domain-containing protein
MAIVRRFLLAPAFARLVRKERGAVRVTEGYFPNQAGRQSHVLVEGSQCHLVLVTPNAGARPTEERTEVPRGHADALLDVCAGKAIYDRSRIAIGGGRDAFVDHVVTPGVLDLVTLEFDEEADAGRFQPVAWFGAEVSGRDGYDNRAIALQGLPTTGEVAISNAALEALLDTLENRGMSRFALPPRPASAGEGGGEVLDTLRRMAASKPESEGLPPAANLPPAAQPAPVAAAPAPEPAPAPAAAPAAENDSRIDDVIASLSQALGAADETPDQPRQGEAVEVERWTSRLRRSQG